MKSVEEEEEIQEAERVLEVMILVAEHLILVVSPGPGHEAEGEGRRVLAIMRQSRNLQCSGLRCDQGLRKGGGAWLSSLSN